MSRQGNLFRPVFSVQRDETYRLVYKVTQDPDSLITGDETVAMHAKRIEHPQAAMPAESVAADFVLTPQFAEAEGDEPDRWYFTVEPEDTADLPNGYYVVDARIELDGGEVHRTAPLVLHLQQYVTAGS